MKKAFGFMLFDLFKKHKKRKKYLNYPESYSCSSNEVEFWGKGRIECGKDVQFGCFPSPDFRLKSYVEARCSEAAVKIGDGTVINNHSSIICRSTTIEIGKKCVIGTNFQCYDSDFHNLSALGREEHKPFEDSPVKISNNVFIGNNVIILKGVTIGENSVIGAGSVVTKSCESDSVYAGNPAKFIKKIEH